jgi:hypothetical protein
MRGLLLALLAGAVVAGGAAASGPWSGRAVSVVDPHSRIRYSALRVDGSTVVRARRGGVVVATARFAGDWAIPAVTSTGAAGGLAADGRTLVLVEPSESRFLVLSTSPLAARATVALQGQFSFDALSPDARWLYLIEHVSSKDLLAYRVRAYDLARRRLVAGAIVAKGEGETMRGYPVARATSTNGRWVYTLYHRTSGAPFVHALNAAQQYAVCIDLPGRRSADGLRLSKDGRKLAVRLRGATVATIDTRSLTLT